MKKNKYKILSIKSGVLKYIELMILILCSVVGVGFISGAEIYEFFVQFGDFYILGILTFLILSFVIIYKILKDIMFENYDKNCNFLQNNNKICVKNTKNGIKFNKIMKDINSLFNVVIISGTMFSGLKHLVRELCCNNYILVYLMVLLSVFLLFIIGVKWLSKIELMVIVFILFMLVSFLCDENFSFNVIKNINKHIKLNNNILLSIIYAGLYVFMNYFQIKPLIISSGIRINNKNNCKYFSLIFSIIITILLLIFSLFLKNNNYLISNKMPFLEYFGNKNK
ncbi:MAG: hypothetical protein IJX17_07210, partial [Clostridia bacterium]|nr:hypothetical protein [Clostridia bacterium]